MARALSSPLFLSNMMDISTADNIGSATATPPPPDSPLNLLAWYPLDARDWPNAVPLFAQPQHMSPPITPSWTFDSSVAGVSADYPYTCYSGMGLGSVSQHPVKSAHQRTPSASTVASTGPASPYAQSFTYPHIANTDFAPNSPAAHLSDNPAISFAKVPPTPVRSPAHLGWPRSQEMSRRQAGRNGWSIDPYADEGVQNAARSARPSLSSSGYDSPATPQSGVGELESMPPSVHLWHSEPDHRFASTPPMPGHLAPPSRLAPMHDQLQRAQAVRSHSPGNSAPRNRSPFRSSPLAPSSGLAAPLESGNHMAERPSHLTRQHPSTISPRDAVYDYRESGNFPPSYPYPAPAPEWLEEDLIPQAVAAPPLMSGYQPPPVEAYPYPEAITYGGVAHPGTGPTLAPNPYQNYGYMNVPKTTPSGDASPVFPAQLLSMESSVSDTAPAPSPQESYKRKSAPMRPADPRAGSNTYTCTYPGCNHRFETLAHLQKHKRESHRTTIHRRVASDDSSHATTASSPSTTGSPGPMRAGMTSAAVAARNSQAGPHRCTHINPTTNLPCNTVFSRPYDLTRHEDTIHNNSKQKVRCPMCREEKTFSRHDALTRHMRVVHPDAETVTSSSKRLRKDD